jgi:hypothetical protein
MTQPYDALGDLHLPSRERDYYQDHRITGWRQLLCAWFILLSVAALFKFLDSISVNRPASFAHASQLTNLADDIDRWERGETRQRTITLPNSLEIARYETVR